MKQAEKIYMISDAAKKVQVEAHVLRYWEEELKVPAKRNEMGHRYYTEEDISRFQKVKELKEQGLQLKAIRHMLKNGDLKTPIMLFEKPEVEKEMQTVQAAETQASSAAEEVDLGKHHVIMVKKGEFLPVEGGTMSIQEESREQKSLRLQQLLKEMIVEAVQTNNKQICQEIKETLLKELDYQFRLQEEKEDAREEERLQKQEEHYQKIDEMLRAYNQKGRRAKKMREKAIPVKQEEEGGKGEEQEQKQKGMKRGFLRKKRSIV
ncbi:MAG: helix-turn-helix domain-containing protein [Lachnospiraceae bacterium]|nr:helix-turn-helix domain-containing protein [Lachnospiraceae bacterium]